MLLFIKKHFRNLTLGLLIFLNMVVWAAVIQRSPGDILRVYFFDVGQGDAILIDSPNHGRMLIDGGPNRKVLTEIGKILPFSDKRIDVVLATHPDKDHIGGLPEVVSRYEVGAFIEPGVKTENSLNDELHKRLEEEKIPVTLARRGMVVNFGDGAKLTILFPDQDVTNWETNAASVIAKLEYGESSYLFTGDSPMRIENVLLNSGEDINADVLKVGHHGSRTSTSLAFAKVVSPEYAVISASLDNSYGHPHKEVLDILGQISAKILNTANHGTIMFKTDGKLLKLK